MSETIKLILIITLLTLTSCGLDPMWVDPPEFMESSKKKAIEIEEFSLDSKYHNYRGIKEYRFVFWVKSRF